VTIETTPRHATTHPLERFESFIKSAQGPDPKNQIRQNRAHCMMRGDDGRVRYPTELRWLRRSFWRAGAETQRVNTRRRIRRR
jgi:hypothetical protein